MITFRRSANANLGFIKKKKSYRGKSKGASKKRKFYKEIIP
jgi:hypothetical protein